MPPGTGAGRGPATRRGRRGEWRRRHNVEVEPDRRDAAPRETPRLLLRPFAPGDFEAVLSYESREDVARYLYWGPRTAEQVRAALERDVANAAVRRPGQTLALALSLRSTGEMIGDVALEWQPDPYRQGELGYIVHPDHQGRGYATEACSAVLRIAFEELGLHRVFARLDARNAASARVLDKLGMRREAHFVESEFVRGEWRSQLVYALLDREWRGPPEGLAKTDRSSIG